eukprot:scaffold127978_cov65-Attheya_sp.AAC.3
MGYGYGAQLADVFRLGHPIGRRGWVGGCGIGGASSGPDAVGGVGAMAGFAELGRHRTGERRVVGVGGFGRGVGGGSGLNLVGRPGAAGHMRRAMVWFGVGIGFHHRKSAFFSFEMFGPYSFKVLQAKYNLPLEAALVLILQVGHEAGGALSSILYVDTV